MTRPKMEFSASENEPINTDISKKKVEISPQEATLKVVPDRVSTIDFKVSVSIMVSWVVEFLIRASKISYIFA